MSKITKDILYNYMTIFHYMCEIFIRTTNKIIFYKTTNKIILYIIPITVCDGLYGPQDNEIFSRTALKKSLSWTGLLWENLYCLWRLFKVHWIIKSLSGTKIRTALRKSGLLWEKSFVLFVWFDNLLITKLLKQLYMLFKLMKK